MTAAASGLILDHGIDCTVRVVELLPGGLGLLTSIAGLLIDCRVSNANIMASLMSVVEFGLIILNLLC
jgi:hypothetical protein